MCFSEGGAPPFGSMVRKVSGTVLVEAPVRGSRGTRATQDVRLE